MTASADALDPQTIRGSKCPSILNVSAAETRVPLVLDWLELDVLGCSTPADLKPGFLFSIDPAFYEGRFWKKIYKVVTLINGQTEVFGELQTDNRNEYYKGWHLRIQNRFLYAHDFGHYLNACISDLKLKFQGIARIDMAFDFQHLGRSTNPSKFIKKCIAGHYLMAGRCKVREFVDKRSIIQGFVTPDGQLVKASDLREILVPGSLYSQVSSEVKIEGCIWGKRSSGFQVRMYNKTQEMKAKDHKPWITAQWEAAGFDMNADTWRLEMELRHKEFNALDPETGMLIDSMRTMDTLTPDNFKRLALMLYTKHFKFHKRVITVKGKRTVLKDRKRRLPEFYPLKLEQAVWQKVPLQRTPDSSRTERTEIKKLVLSYEEFKHVSPSLAKEMKNLIALKVIKYAVYEWFTKEYPGFIDFDNVECEVKEYTNQLCVEKTEGDFLEFHSRDWQIKRAEQREEKRKQDVKARELREQEKERKQWLKEQTSLFEIQNRCPVCQK